MLHDFEPGDFLIFQLESGYALLRVLAVDNSDPKGVWHLLSYEDLFLDTDTADTAIQNPAALTVGLAHVALTNHAFESTQVARLKNVPLTENELEGYRAWRKSEERKVFDRSIRLLLGLR